jgi:hypothetical protein
MSDEFVLTIDTDNITVDAFLELVELHEQMADGVSGGTLRRMVDLLKPAVTNIDMGKLPYSRLKPTIEQIMSALNTTIDPN